MRRAAVLLCLLYGVSTHTNLKQDEEFFVRYLMSGAMDTMQHTHIELWKLYIQRQTMRGHASYEIGFLVRTTEERYRKMVDLYNTSVLMSRNNTLRSREHVVHLQKIEMLHWDVMHLTNMLHEVERKYHIEHQVLDGNSTKTRRSRKTTTPTTNVSHCSGLDADVQKILSELSWFTRPMFLDYIDYVKPNKSTSFRTALRQIFGIRRVRSTDEQFPSKLVWGDTIDEIGHDLYSSSPINQHIRKARSIASTLLSSREFNESILRIDQVDDDDVMKMKLFRLMYESVKDSDLKIKRAELVKSEYENSSSFDLGYVFGDVSDKLNVMVDISKTLRRMHDTWRPVEHVNAYEQIANLAIEVSHLVDMVRTITATEPTTTVKS